MRARVRAQAFYFLLAMYVCDTRREREIKRVGGGKFLGHPPRRQPVACLPIIAFTAGGRNLFYYFLDKSSVRIFSSLPTVSSSVINSCPTPISEICSADGCGNRLSSCLRYVKLFTDLSLLTLLSITADTNVCQDDIDICRISHTEIRVKKGKVLRKVEKLSLQEIRSAVGLLNELREKTVSLLS